MTPGLDPDLIRAGAVNMVADGYDPYDSLTALTVAVCQLLPECRAEYLDGDA